MKSLKATGRSCVWNVVEKFHTNTPTTTSTIHEQHTPQRGVHPQPPTSMSLKTTTASVRSQCDGNRLRTRGGRLIVDRLNDGIHALCALRLGHNVLDQAL